MEKNRLYTHICMFSCVGKIDRLQSDFDFENNLGEELYFPPSTVCPDAGPTTTTLNFEKEKASGDLQAFYPI